MYFTLTCVHLTLNPTCHLSLTVLFLFPNLSDESVVDQRLRFIPSVAVPDVNAMRESSVEEALFRVRMELKMILKEDPRMADQVRMKINSTRINSCLFIIQLTQYVISTLLLIYVLILDVFVSLFAVFLVWGVS